MSKNNSRRFAIIATLGVGGLSGLSAHAQIAAQPVSSGTESGETAGWKTIAGGPGTGCATDASPFEFYVHQGDARLAHADGTRCLDIIQFPQ